jgi:hypothetical protein
VPPQIDPKRAIPKKDDSRTDKLFVRNIPQGVTQPMFQDFFAKFGVLADCTLMMDRASNTHRGFGFVTYKSEETVDQVVANQPYAFLGQQVRFGVSPRHNQTHFSAQIEVRKSAPRARDDDNFGGGRGRGRGGGPPGGSVWGNNAFGNHGGGGGAGMAMGASGAQGFGANPAMGAGFDPNAMAEYFKQMGWGAMNPMMMMNPMMFGMGGMAGGDPSQQQGQGQFGNWSQAWNMPAQQPGAMPAANAFGQQSTPAPMNVGPPPNAPVRRPAHPSAQALICSHRPDLAEALPMPAVRCAITPGATRTTTRIRDSVQATMYTSFPGYPLHYQSIEWAFHSLALSVPASDCSYLAQDPVCLRRVLQRQPPLRV